MERFDTPRSRFLFSPQRRPALFDDPLGEWSESLLATPDLRWDKVQRVREAIRLDAYEDERIINLLIERVEHEIEVLRRRDDL